MFRDLLPAWSWPIKFFLWETPCLFNGSFDLVWCQPDVIFFDSRFKTEPHPETLPEPTRSLIAFCSGKTTSNFSSYISLQKRMTLVPAPFCTCAPKTFHRTAEPLKHHRTLCRRWKWRCSRGSKCVRAFIKHVKHVLGVRSESNPINSYSDSPIYKLVQSYLWFYEASSKGSEDTFASLPANAKCRKHGITLTHLLAGCKSAEISVASIGLVVLESSLKLGLLIRSWAFDRNTEGKAEQLYKRFLEIPCIFLSSPSSGIVEVAEVETDSMAWKVVLEVTPWHPTNLIDHIKLIKPFPGLAVGAFVLLSKGRSSLHKLLSSHLCAALQSIYKQLQSFSQVYIRHHSIIYI